MIGLARGYHLSQAKLLGFPWICSSELGLISGLRAKNKKIRFRLNSRPGLCAKVCYRSHGLQTSTTGFRFQEDFSRTSNSPQSPTCWPAPRAPDIRWREAAAALGPIGGSAPPLCWLLRRTGDGRIARDVTRHRRESAGRKRVRSRRRVRLRRPRDGRPTFGITPASAKPKLARTGAGPSPGRCRSCRSVAGP
jgi:hypothetical protein